MGGLIFSWNIAAGMLLFVAGLTLLVASRIRDWSEPNERIAAREDHLRHSASILQLFLATEFLGIAATAVGGFLLAAVSFSEHQLAATKGEITLTFRDFLRRDESEMRDLGLY